MVDLQPRRESKKEEILMFQGDLERFELLKEKLNHSLGDGEGSFPDEDIFSFMLDQLEEHVVKKKRKSKSSRKASKKTTTNPDSGDKPPAPPTIRLS